ncbi:MAG: inositol 2-dehydrogenase [Rhodothermales bacterium]|nr:inositol 2-dehydrogenase [Rhodothermales bacterium]
MPTPLRLGLIGAGRIGRIHAETIVNRIPDAALVAVADPHVEAAAGLAALYSGVSAYANAQAILDDPNVDAVAICSSSDTHAAYIETAAEAGKHIFCEKPIAIDIASIDRALAAVARAGVKFQVGFQRRFDPSFGHAKRLIASGAYGEPRILRITSRDPGPPPIAYLAASGGIFFDMTIHDFDMARFLIDSEVTEVYAIGGVMVDPEIGEKANDIDTAVVTLRYANGAICTIDNCRQSAYGYDQRVEWFGSKGRVAVENHNPDAVVTANADAVHSAKPLFFFLERYMDAYRAEMEAFVEAVVNDTPVPVTGRDGRMPAVIGKAAWLSYREGRPVRIAEVDPG